MQVVENALWVVVYFVGIFVFIVALCFALVYVLYAYTWGFSRIDELLYLRQNRRILKRLKELKTSGFAPTLQYVHWGKGVVIDGPGRRIFLANDKAMKLYSIDDVIKVESDFKFDQTHPYTAMRITVRDLESPLFEIQGNEHTSKLREIDSLLLVMREPSKAQAAATSQANDDRAPTV